MSNQENVRASIKEREDRFNAGLKALCNETQMALQVFPAITPDGRIAAGLRLVDNSPEAKAAREAQEKQQAEQQAEQAGLSEA